MKNKKNKNVNKYLENLMHGRERTNLLRKQEQQAIAFLVQRIPSWISSDMLTTVGFLGGIIIFISFILGKYFSNYWLLLTVAGFAVSWFGDSLDGRIAYYRNKPRKWYGFILDLTTDWIGVAVIGWGFIVYLEKGWEMLGYTFVVLYGWEIMSALLRYKVTGQYSIDSGVFGPTEVRIILSLIVITETFVPGSILFSAMGACFVLLITNILDFIKLLKLADAKDKKEQAEKEIGTKP